ncbi:hypothetical protein LE190_16365 [Massilia oculi]|uniref:Secreted protein n=1 Tax=Massilia hydrophila TaxID=3044279 RepID=A0ABS7YCP9_9BURK|nr:MULTISPECIES: hypothetical protein [Massilia]MCA1245971.1 hypothetical protein [Massilia sp. MS-15]MCA1857489.1 hypothetical protein [Massilia oculi]
MPAMVILPTVAFLASACPIFGLAIASRAGTLYNLQPNQSSSQYFLGASAFIWLGCEYKKMGRCPFFFCYFDLRVVEKRRAAV